MALVDNANFALYDDGLLLEPEEQLNPVVRFVPTVAGIHETNLVVASNDPNQPLRMITLKGRAFNPAGPIEPTPEQATEAAGNCGCRVAGQPGGPHAAWLLLLPLAVVLRRRRR